MNVILTSKEFHFYGAEIMALTASQCCNPDLNGGGFWGIFNAVLGWQNSATIGSVISYNLYWLAVTMGFLVMIYKDKGHWPFIKTKEQPEDDDVQPLLGSSST